MYTRISQDASFTKKYDWQKTFQEFISLSNLPVFSMTKFWLNNEEINEVALQMKKIIQTRTHSMSCLKLWADIQPGLRVCVDFLFTRTSIKDAERQCRRPLARAFITSQEQGQPQNCR